MAESETRCKGQNGELHQLKAELHSAQKQRDASAAALDAAHKQLHELQDAAAHAAAQQQASRCMPVSWVQRSQLLMLTIC